ncbi:hypothetical protein ABZX75_17620 [Streptomyces sp. NPDC003038]|uniref:hypothetical protein n=1 Tax=unclassified Streptomyces TaxID=2593676 RepID=UPI0033A60DDE
MPCSCNKKREQFEVVADGGQGKVLFSSSSQPTCEAVAKRYAGSIVRPKAPQGAASTSSQ